jgi:4-hydroxy-tetrahydrodipicolinate synthase
MDSTVLSGDDSLTLPFLSVGAVGVVSVASNLFPKEVVKLVRLFLEGKATDARQLHRKFFNLFKDIISSNQIRYPPRRSSAGAE